MNDYLSFDNLINNVESIHTVTSTYAKGAVNQLLTVRNWMIGYFIVEFEQNGKNRAEYGKNLLGEMAEKLKIKGLDRTHLNLCRVFYIKYPHICATVSHKLQGIGETKLLPELSSGITDKHEKMGKNEKCATVSHEFETPPEVLISRLSFSHIREIMTLDDSFERFFYEYECIKGTWSVRELRRQITTNLYVRAGVSKKPELLLDKLINNDFSSVITVKDPITLEFLGLDADKAISESDLEQALIDHLQEFMLELGNGFCFEARHKRILIDD